MRLTYWNDRKGSFDWLCDNNEIANKLAAYEDTMFEPEEIKLNMDGLDEYHKAESEGRLVRLPCKVGDSVFRYSHVEQQIQFLKCEGFLYDGISWKVRCTDFIQSWVGNQKRHFYIAASNFGKAVFLTREEAEAALKSKDKQTIFYKKEN